MAFGSDYSSPAYPPTIAPAASNSGFFGSLLSGLGSLISTAAPVAANVYSLQMQGDVLKSQALANQTAAAAAAAKAATPATPISPTVMYSLLAVAGLIVAVIFLRGRR